MVRALGNFTANISSHRRSGDFAHAPTGSSGSHHAESKSVTRAAPLGDSRRRRGRFTLSPAIEPDRVASAGCIECETSLIGDWGTKCLCVGRAPLPTAPMADASHRLSAHTRTRIRSVVGGRCASGRSRHKRAKRVLPDTQTSRPTTCSCGGISSTGKGGDSAHLLTGPPLVPHCANAISGAALQRSASPVPFRGRTRRACTSLASRLECE